jgi:RND family efflux transporter MFP subunit
LVLPHYRLLDSVYHLMVNMNMPLNFHKLFLNFDHRSARRREFCLKSLSRGSHLFPLVSLCLTVYRNPLRRPKMLQRSRLAGSLWLVGLLLFAGCSRPSEVRPTMPPLAVNVAAPLQEKIVEWNEFTGRVEAAHSVEVRSRIGGYLQSVHFEEGQNVRKDARLFVVDPRPFEAELAKAKAALEEAKAQLARAEAQLLQANAAKSTAGSQFNFAKSDYQRSLELGNALSQSERDLARSEYLKAQAAVESSDAGIALAEAEVMRSKAAIVTSEASVKAAELNLEYTNIKSPIDGRISRKFVTEGNLISGGSEQSTLLTTIVSLDPIYFVFDASEQQVLRFQRMVQEGTRRSVQEVRYPVYLALADEEGYPHSGYLDFVNNQFDPTTATLLARAAFENSDGMLTPGIFAKLRVANTLEYVAMLLPDSAIGSDQSEKFVYVVGADKRVSRRVVETGPLALGLRVIRSGLEPDEQVVINGLQRVRPGAEVDPRPATLRAMENDPNIYDSTPVEKD